MLKPKNQYSYKNLNINILEFVHDSGLRVVIATPIKGIKKDLFLFKNTYTTLPENKTGLAHITEHVVLHGSKKYQSKDLFFQLMRQSPTENMNAATYDTFTTYYFATPTYKLLKEAAEIYLDTTFAPRLETTKILQEGVNIVKKADKHLNANNINQYVTGVVFNEMLGAYNSPYSEFFQIPHIIYKELKNKKSPAGYPPDMVFITPEDIKRFYAKNYSPNNGFLLLYGTFKNLDTTIQDFDTLLNEKTQFHKELIQRLTKEVKNFSNTQNSNKTQNSDDALTNNIKNKKPTAFTPAKAPKDPITIKVNASSKHAKYRLAFVIPIQTKLPKQTYENELMEFLLQRAFSKNCGYILKFTKQNKLLQMFWSELIDELPENFFIIEFEGIDKKDIKKAIKNAKEAILRTLDSINLSEINNYISNTQKKISLFSKTPYMDKFSYTIDKYYHLMPNSLDTVMSTIDSPIIATKKHIQLLKEYFSNMFTFIIEPDTNYITNIKEQIVKNLKKTKPYKQQTNKTASKTEQPTEKQLLKPYVSYINKKLYFPYISQVNNTTYFIKSPDNKLSTSIIYMPITNILKKGNNLQDLTYWTYLKLLFANTNVYPSNYKKIICRDYSTYYSGLDIEVEGRTSNLKFYPFLQIYLSSLKGREKDAFNRTYKTLDYFDINKINIKRAKLQIQSFINTQKNPNPDKILGAGVYKISSKIHSENLLPYLLRYKPFLDIVTNPNYKPDLDSIIAKVFELKDTFVLSNNKTLSIISGFNLNSRLVQLEKDFRSLVGSNPTNEYPSLSPWTQTNQEQESDFIYNANIQSMYLYLIGVPNTELNNTNIKTRATAAILARYLANYVALPLGRFKYKAYGAYFKIYVSNKTSWQLYFYRMPKEIGKNDNKLLNEFMENAYKTKFKSTFIKQIALQLVARQTNPKPNVDIPHIYAPYAIGLKNPEDKEKYVEALLSVTKQDLQELRDKIFTDFKIHKVIVK